MLIAEEPTTALDVTIQATILQLLREIRDRRGMAILFITHDLGVIAEIADSVAVMYQGKLVEYGSAAHIFTLDSRMNISSAVMEPLRIHPPRLSDKQRRERVAELLERVGLSPEYMRRYPHELSGGQRQRVCIARSLALNPKFIICDESVSALDVSVQAQVLNLLRELQTEFSLTYIFISHDLSVVRFLSDRIMVMNRGQIEEIGASESVLKMPTSNYTRQLIQATPKVKTEEMLARQSRRALHP